MKRVEIFLHEEQRTMVDTLVESGEFTGLDEIVHEAMCHWIQC